MTVIFSDDAAGALSGTNWADEAGVWSTTGGEFACSTGSFRVLKTTTSAHAAIADVLVTARRASGASFDGCVLARSNVSGATSSVGDCYFLNFFDTSKLQFYRRIAGVNSQIGSDINVATVDGSLVGLKVTGAGATVTLVAYVDGVQVGTEGDSGGTRIVVAGQTGLVGFNSSSRYDDFSVDNLIVVATLLPGFYSPTRTILRM